MSDSESDIEIKSSLPKKLPKKPAPKSPSDDIKNNNKKISTKMMIIDALTELKTRKGVSLYAIKKYLTEKYNVNTEKVNYLIKKSIKAGVEDGTFVQIKGIGASGSFKLATVKEKPKTKKKVEKIVTDKPETTAKVKIDKKPTIKQKKMDIKEKKERKEVKKPKDVKKTKKDDVKMPKKKVEKEEKSKKAVKKATSENEEIKVKKSKVKIAKGMQTPSKKRAAMMKRKSIGSIIKPPKMKPKSQA